MRLFFVRNGKAQVAYEFILVFFTLTLGFTVWVMLSSSLQNDFNARRLSSEVNDLGLSLQDTLYTAVQMPDGFSRSFSLPYTVLGYDYSIKIYNMGSFSMFDLSVLDQVSSFQAPIIKGDFVKGVNFLRVSNGVVCLNNAC